MCSHLCACVPVLFQFHVQTSSLVNYYLKKVIIPVLLVLVNYHFLVILN